MMKRRIVLIMLVAIIALSAAACSGKSDSSDTTDKTTGGVNANSESKKVEIEFWYGLGGKLGETMEATIEEFNSSQNEVVVNGVKQADYAETGKMLQAAIASGEVPSSFLSNHQLPNTLYNKGVIERLNDYIVADPGFNEADIIKSFYEYCKTDKEDVYSLPVWGTTQVIYYRKDMFENAGLDPDEVFATWQNVADAALKLKQTYSDVEGYYGFEPMYGMDCLLDMACSNGADIVSADSKTVTFDSDAAIEAMESARKWINEEQIMGIHFGGEGWEYWYKTIDDVMQGRAGGYVGSSGDQGDLDFDIIAAHVQPGFGNNPPRPYVDPITVGIMSGAPAEQKSAAFKWLTYLNQTATKEFAMKTGYVPVRSSVKDDPKFKEYLNDHPQALVPIQQAEIGRKKWYDLTGGKVEQALTDACDLIEIENKPAAEALHKAKEVAQAALDEYWANVDDSAN
jgi:multiple sugar transport system substrate-binding protein